MGHYQNKGPRMKWNSSPTPTFWECLAPTSFTCFTRQNSLVVPILIAYYFWLVSKDFFLKFPFLDLLITDWLWSSNMLIYLIQQVCWEQVVVIFWRTNKWDVCVLCGCHLQMKFHWEFKQDFSTSILYQRWIKLT